MRAKSKAWTQDDVNLLVQMARDGKNNLAMCTALGRKPYTLAQMLGKLRSSGVKLPKRVRVAAYSIDEIPE